jgi:hypothetical protein
MVLIIIALMISASGPFWGAVSGGKNPVPTRIGQADVGAEALKRDDPRAVVRFFAARKCWRVYYGDFGTIAAASIALNLRGKFSDCGK